MSSNSKSERNRRPAQGVLDTDIKNNSSSFQNTLSQKDPSLKSNDANSNNQSDFSNLNNSDLLSISKTDSSLSNNSFEKIKNVKPDTSNVLVSFSNISETDRVNVTNLSSSIVCTKDNKESALTPSTLCNYYQHSNSNTPCSHCSQDEVNIGTNIKQTNLNVIYSNLNNNSSINGSSKSKKTPIKYTKSQLNKNEDNNINNIEKKNLINLFNESNGKNNDIFSNLEIKEEIANSIHYDSVNKNKVVNVNRNKQSETFKVENITNLEFVNQTSNNMQFEVRNCSNFSFDITKQYISTLNNNNESNHSLNVNDTSKHIEYISPKFSNGFQLTPSSNASTKEKTTKNNSKETKHNKYISSFSLLTNKIVKSSSTNKLTKHKQSASYSKSKSKEKESLKNQTMNSKISSILGNHIFLKLKPRSVSKKMNNKTISVEKNNNSGHNSNKKKNTSNTINFIHNLKPLSFLKGNNDEQKINFKALIKIKSKYSPSPSNKNGRNSKPKTNNNSVLRKKKIINASPKSNNTNLNVTSHMNNSLYSEYNTTKGIINTNPNNVSAGNSICGNNTTVKRPLKVIQNFSNYKRKSELMNSSKRSIKEKKCGQIVKNKHVISKKINKIGGDKDSNSNLDEY